jgi:hypothetical protein
MTEILVRTRRVGLRPCTPLTGVDRVEALRDKGVADFPGIGDVLAPLPASPDDSVEQFLAVSPGDETVLGYCSLSYLDRGERHLQVDVVMDDSNSPVGVFLEAAVLTVERAFTAWPVDEVRLWLTEGRAGGLRAHPGMAREAADPGVPHPPGLESASRFVISREPWELYGSALVRRLSRRAADG